MVCSEGQGSPAGAEPADLAGAQSRPLQGSRIAVVGAGLAGLCTAYSLERRGASVTVFDGAKEVASLASYANAGRFCPARLLYTGYAKVSTIVTVAQQCVLPTRLYEYLNPQGDLASSVRISFSLVHYGAWFLRNCTAARNEQNNVALVKLARRVGPDMERLVSEVGVSAAALRRTNGNVWFPGFPGQFDGTPEKVRTTLESGSVEVLDAEQCALRFPELSALARRRSGCALAHTDWTADAREVCFGIARYLRGDFVLGRRVLSVDPGQQLSVRLEDGEVLSGFDYAVLCTGLHGGLLAGQRLPLLGMQGISIDLYGVKNTPSIGAADFGSGILNWQVTPLGPESARIVGFADFSEAEPSASELASKTNRLLEHARQMLPDMDWASQRDTYVCYRPMTPDSIPIISPVEPGSNMWLGCGLGAVGWTVSASVGELLAEGLAAQKAGHPLPDDLKPFSAQRFTLSGFCT